MVSDFLGAAFPWILVGLFVAVSCSLMSKKRNKFPFVGKNKYIIKEPDAQTTNL